jgi:hypothetical protein
MLGDGGSRARGEPGGIIMPPLPGMGGRGEKGGLYVGGFGVVRDWRC